MMKKVIKVAIITAIGSWVLSSTGFQDSRILSTSQVIGADRGVGSMLKAGQKHWIDEDYYFVYDFDKRPQMGTVIIKIQVFSKDGKQDSTLEITGSADMPSMRGAHGTGDQRFQLNKKGDYLLPVNVVMPGEWEVVLNFLKDKKAIYTGIVRFNV
ncbi:MAG: hypothetical protein QG552_3300 [Thermodesulfobacteriota bacterium]|nr:hypothetical protein [Thermodesulfobacteriota bacterium]